MQLKMTHSRERSYIIFNCRQQVAKLYEFEGLPQEQIRRKVEFLLEGDRFLCRQDYRQVGKPWKLIKTDTKRREIGLQI